MSRGPGKIQRQIVDALADGGVRTTFGVAVGVYGMRTITRAEYESMRRALVSLARRHHIHELFWRSFANDRGNVVKLWCSDERFDLELERMARWGEAPLVAGKRPEVPNIWAPLSVVRAELSQADAPLSVVSPPLLPAGPVKSEEDATHSAVVAEVEQVAP